ncbi:MAG: DUF342 domain-containing protein, partial [Chitinivibrionales bacterium]|nr:DUF342 domain-containing protein [Chitinivibrionales bacterium]MBD3355670.1 DUF342 domain-containing protein [Chitinivibrionales bacterium]
MIIDLDQAVPGMRITDDVVLPTGGVLIKAPATLTDTLIATLKKHEVEQVAIVRVDTATTEETTIVSENPPPTSSSNVSAAEVLPRITVILSQDHMSASMRLEPGSGSPGRLTVDLLSKALADQGVRYGIQEGMLDAAVGKWRTANRLYEFKNVAAGKKPIPGREGTVHVCVKHLTDGARLSAAKNAEHFWQLQDLDLSLQQVTPGMTVARRQGGTPPVAGKNVHGEEVASDTTIKSNFTLDDSVYPADNGHDIIAAVEGLAYWVDNTIGVVPIDFDGGVELTVAPDSMSATLTCRPAFGTGITPQEKEIRDLIVDKGIVRGVKEDVIADLREHLAKGRCPKEPVVIAEGVPAVDGENGKIDFYFNTNTTLAPKENPDGTVDYKSVDIVQSVEAGAELARVLPPGKGTPGVNIYGEGVRSKDGNPATLPAGPNTQPHPENEDVLIASTDGIVRYDGKVVEVSEGYVISG